MKQSKLLKKSLAALLAILMVAAMIPMSAFAEEAPMPCQIRVNKLDAKWENGAFTADVKDNSDIVTINVIDQTGVSVRIEEEGYTAVTSTTGPTIDLSELASTKPEGIDGVYGLTVVVTKGNDVQKYPLNINYTWVAKSGENTIADVDLSKFFGAVGRTISGNTITIQMKLGASLTAVASVDTTTAVGGKKFVWNGADAGKWHDDDSNGVFVKEGDIPQADLVAVFKSADANFVATGGKMSYASSGATGTLTVTAANGDQRIYTVKFENEPHFTSFAIDGVAGKISGNNIVVDMPYGYDDDALNDADITWTFGSNISKITDKKASTPNDLESGVSSLKFVNGVAESGYDVYTLDTTDHGGSLVAVGKNRTNPAVSAGSQDVSLKVRVPDENPSADLTAIQLGTKGQRYEIPEGQTTINVVAPYSEDNVTSIKATIWGAKNAKAIVPSGSTGGVDQTPATVVPAGVPLGTNVDINNPYFLINVTSEDGSTTKQYRINVTKATNAARDPKLESIKLVGKDTKGNDIEIPGAINQSTKKIAFQIPYAIAHETVSATSALSTMKIVAKSTDGSSIDYIGTGSAAALLSSGVTSVENSFGNDAGSGIDLPTGNGTADVLNYAKEIIVWSSSDNADTDSGDAAGNAPSTLIKKVEYDVTLTTGNYGTGSKITSAAITTAGKVSEISADNTYPVTVEGTTLKVTIPYGLSNSGRNPIANFHFTELVLDPGAAAYVTYVNDTTTTLGTGTAISAATKKAIGTTIATDSGTNYDWENSTKPLKIRVFDEKTYTETNTGTTFDKITSGYTDYTVQVVVTPAKTGSEMLNITSDVDTNVKVVFDAAHKSARITVPASYADATNTSGKHFSLNFAASEGAFIKMGSAAANKDVVSDKGSKDTKGATQFYVRTDGVLCTVDGSGNEVVLSAAATSGTTGLIDVWDEAEKVSTHYTFAVVVADAEKDATLESIKVGEVSASADAEDASKWTLVLPYETLLTQKVDIQGVSKVAGIQVNGTAYDPDKEYDLSKPLTIKITAEDGVAVETYTLTTTLGEPSTEADITAAKVGEVEATIAGETITAVVPEDFDFTQAVAVSFEVSEGAKVTKLGEAAPTETYTFTDGEAVAVEVTAQDGKTTKTYQLVVTTKKPSSENTITELTVDGIAATIAEDAITAEAENPASVTLDITLPEGATAKVGETEYTAGMTVDATEAVTIVVTAEDGTEKTYTLTVTKKAEQPKPGLDDVNDVPADHWAAEAIADILSRGIMTPNSKGNFRPNETVSRGMFAVMMCQLYGVNPEDYADAENPYTDIKKGDWFYNAALAAVANDWMTGTSSTTFSPKEPVTREQTALIIAKAQGLSKVEAPAELYSDDAKIADWAKGWVYACKDADLISYMSASQKTFNPKGDLTRAQIATILTKIHPDTEKPDEPENPDEGNNPENPDEGNNPENPDEGNNPENPDEGNTPENPDEGNNPENPDEGNNPENPDEGSNPENPDEGNTPENPDEGNTPETPDEGETPAE